MLAIVIVSNQEYRSGEDPFPPVGTKGAVISGPDVYNEYEILFENYPPPTLCDPSWTVHKSMIVFIDKDKEDTKESCKALQFC